MFKRTQNPRSTDASAQSRPAGVLHASPVAAGSGADYMEELAHEVEPTYLLGSVHGVLACAFGIVSLALLAAAFSYRSLLLGVTGLIALAFVAATVTEIRRLCRREQLWHGSSEQRH